ncbi:MAG TPA: DNA polymerase I [Solirubrobacteraceae bacterium]|nr:DNA polymerase I [Solirubrobacteraceae bacterium]
MERRVFLIDGPSLVYRAFYALPESIATSTGEPTNAIFGFASMLVKIITDYGVRPTVVAWDAGSSGRTELFADYKAGRRSRPDLLKAQWPAMEPLVEAFGYRNVKLEGYEADDVIATLAEQARAAEVPVTIVTGDRDVFQLIDEQGLVQVMATARGITETKLYDRQAVIDRYGLPPELIPDFYGLKGDTSDNIPGIPGIGEKTASELIQRFGGLEQVLSHVDEISGPKRKQNLLEHAENARMSMSLATVQRGLALDFDPGGEAAHEPDRSRLREVFRRYELRDPLRRLEEALGEVELAKTTSSDEVKLTAHVRHGTVADVAKLVAAGDAAQELCVVVHQSEAPEGELFAEGSPWRFAVYAQRAPSIESSPEAQSPPNAEPSLGVQPPLSGRPALGVEPTLHGEAPAVKQGLAGGARRGSVLVGDCGGPEGVVAACADRSVVAHDAKALGLVPPGLAHDTLLGAYLLEPARRGYPFDELCEERGLVADVEDPVAAQALLLGALATWQREQIVERELQAVMGDIELPLVSVLREMELLGVRLNVERLREITERVYEEIEALEARIFALAEEEFTIGSPQQLGEILFVKLGLSRKRRGKTGFSTDARVLQAIREEHEIVPCIERWRELSTLIKTYLDVLPQMVDERARIHTTFLQAGAQTGRLASTNPNMQNVPIRTPLGREIRGCFEADDGCVLISADYSQIELRVLAHAAEEPVLVEIFERGEDVHTATASEVFGVTAEQIDPGMRSKAKMINYGIVYGLSDFGLADRLNIPREEAKVFIDAYLARFSRVAQFIEETIELAKQEGHVKTLWGRRRQIPELQARNYQVRSLGERLAVNTVIQGTAADIIKLAMVRCHDTLRDTGLATKQILTIHDELLFEGPPDERGAACLLIEEEMCGVWEHSPPMAVDIGVGQNWLEAK